LGFERIVVRGGISLVDVAGLVFGAAKIEDALGQGRLAGVHVSDDADIPQILEHDTLKKQKTPGGWLPSFPALVGFYIIGNKKSDFAALRPPSGGVNPLRKAFHHIFIFCSGGLRPPLRLLAGCWIKERTIRFLERLGVRLQIFQAFILTKRRVWSRGMLWQV